MKTAVELFAQRLIQRGIGYNINDFEEALEMEKEQKKELVIATYIDLKMKDCQLPYGMEYHNKLLKVEEEAEQYYKQTFKQKKYEF